MKQLELPMETEESPSKKLRVQLMHFLAAFSEYHNIASFPDFFSNTGGREGIQTRTHQSLHTLVLQEEQDGWPCSQSHYHRH